MTGFETGTESRERAFQRYELQMASDRSTAAHVMEDVVKNLQDQGLTTEEAVVERGWNIQTFIPRTSRRIIHVEVYVGTMADNLAPPDIRIRELDRKEMERLRALASHGSEEGAVRRRIADRQPMPLSQTAITEFLVEHAFKKRRTPKKS